MSIFLNVTGAPLQIFVEASSVHQRPKLVRKMGGFGAAIATNAKEADILLAEPNTKEAVELLDAWGEDKPVLSARWAWRCMDLWTFLGPADNWGGFKLDREAILQGLDMDEEYNDEENGDTPPEPITKTPSSGRASSNNSVFHPVMGPPRTETPPAKRRRISSSSKASPSFATPPSSQSNASLFPPSSQLSQSNNFPSSSQLSQSNNFPPSSQPSPSQNHPQLSQQPNALFQQALLSTLFGVPQVQQQPAPQQQPSLPPNIPGQMLDPSLLQQVLMNSMNNNPQLLQLLAAQQILAAQQNQQNPMASTPTPVSPTRNGVASPSGALGRHRTPSEEPEIEYLREDDGEELSPSSSRTKRRKRNEPRGRESYSDISSLTPSPRIKRPSSKVQSSPTKAERFEKVVQGIFTQPNGQPMLFFVMAPMKSVNRREIIKAIKNNGGKIAEKMSEADHIILDRPSKDSAKDFLSMYEQIPHDMIAVGPAWVQRCNETKTFVDRAAYILDVTSVPERKVPSKVGQSKTKIDPPKEPVELESEEEDVRQHLDAGQLSRQSVGQQRSPPPPEPVMHGNGARFTEEDIDWFFRYARYKLEQKPEISRTALMDAVAARAPHHSISSWTGHIYKNHDERYQDLREEFRLRLMRNSQSGSQTQTPIPPISQTAVLSPSNAPSVRTSPNHNDVTVKVEKEAEIPPVNDGSAGPSTLGNTVGS